MDNTTPNFVQQTFRYDIGWYDSFPYIDGLVQERRNSSALAMQWRLSCTNPSIWQHMFLEWPHSVAYLILHISTTNHVNGMDNIWCWYEITYTYTRMSNNVRQLFQSETIVLPAQMALQIPYVNEYAIWIWKCLPDYITSLFDRMISLFRLSLTSMSILLKILQPGHNELRFNNPTHG